jgi:hypothetical protein
MMQGFSSSSFSITAFSVNAFAFDGSPPPIEGIEVKFIEIRSFTDRRRI